MAWELPPGATTLEVTVSVPYFGELRRACCKRQEPRPSRAGGGSSGRSLAGSRRAPRRPSIVSAPPPAHILINRDGPAIQPGPRRYTRSWVRDCVIMGAALAKAGLPARVARVSHMVCARSSARTASCPAWWTATASTGWSNTTATASSSGASARCSATAATGASCEKCCPMRARPPTI